MTIESRIGGKRDKYERRKQSEDIRSLLHERLLSGAFGDVNGLDARSFTIWLSHDHNSLSVSGTVQSLQSDIVANNFMNALKTFDEAKGLGDALSFDDEKTMIEKIEKVELHV